MGCNFGGGYNKYEGSHFGKDFGRYASTSELGIVIMMILQQKTDGNIFAKANYQINLVYLETTIA
jgi:iron complex outermembrane receptor protein